MIINIINHAYMKNNVLKKLFFIFLLIEMLHFLLIKESKPQH